jgi:hypothetical protein
LLAASMGHAACAAADSLHGKQCTMTAHRCRGCSATLHAAHGGLTAASAHRPAAHLQPRVQLAASAANGAQSCVTHPVVRLAAASNWSCTPAAAPVYAHATGGGENSARQVRAWPWTAHGTLHILDQGAVRGCRLHASAGALGGKAALHLSPEAAAPACTHSTRQHTSCDWWMPHRHPRAHACCCSAEWTQPGAAGSAGLARSAGLA